MDNLNNFCCICLNKYEILKPIFSVDCDKITYYAKLTTSIIEMCFEEMNDQRLLCKDCCDNINVIYSFRQKCLRSKTFLKDYTTQTQFDDKKLNCGVVKQLEMRNIKSECNNEYNLKKFDSSFENCGNKHNFNSTVIKNDSYVRENCKYGNESNNKIYQQEKYVENEILKTDNFNISDTNRSEIKSEIDIEEHCLIECKPEINLEFGYDLNYDRSCNTSQYTEDMNTTKDATIVIKNKKKLNVTLGNQETHIVTHFGEKPYECNTCKKSFTLKSNFNAHKRSHTGEKPFECEICKKLFTYKSNFIVHMRTHTGQKPFECVVCKKTFTHKSNLNEHMRIHTGEQPFECSICNRTFTQKCNFNKHVVKCKAAEDSQYIYSGTNYEINSFPTAVHISKSSYLETQSPN